MALLLLLLVRIPPPRYLRLGNDTMEAEYMEKPSWLV
jgi:hypothetical protein